jgi:hypothetical protein
VTEKQEALQALCGRRADELAAKEAELAAAHATWERIVSELEVAKRSYLDAVKALKAAALAPCEAELARAKAISPWEFR